MGWPDVRSDRIFISFVQPVVDASLRKGARDSGRWRGTQHSGIYHSADAASAATAIGRSLAETPGGDPPSHAHDVRARSRWASRMLTTLIETTEDDGRSRQIP